jgi:TPR repeat protein
MPACGRFCCKSPKLLGDAQYVLGALYQLGEAVPQDHGEAVKWFSHAADQGLTVAQFALGRMYAFGHGVPEDIVRAHMWLDLGGRAGRSDRGCAEIGA